MTDQENITVQKLRENFPEEILDVGGRPNDVAVTVRRDRIPDICRFLRDDPDLSYKYFIDICGVDYMEMEKTPRFAVIYNLLSFEKGHRIRLKVLLEESDPAVDSVIEIWKGADWFEREAFDMFGIQFRNHPFLRRILTHHQFVGHPLRKDYEHGRRQLCTEVWDLEFD